MTTPDTYHAPRFSPGDRVRIRFPLGRVSAYDGALGVILGSEPRGRSGRNLAYLAMDDRRLNDRAYGGSAEINAAAIWESDLEREVHLICEDVGAEGALVFLVMEDPSLHDRVHDDTQVAAFLPHDLVGEPHIITEDE